MYIENKASTRFAVIQPDAALFVLVHLAFVGALLTALLFDTSAIPQLDYVALQSELFIKVNSHFSGWGVFWINVTQLGDAAVLLPFFSVYVVINPRVWASLCFAVIPCALLSVGTKTLTAIPRPAAVLDTNEFFVIGEALAAHNSFPSGHTLTAFAVVVAVVGASRSGTGQAGQWRWWVFGAYILASLVGVSRIAVGAHWPFDVLVGALLGVIGGSCGVVLSQIYYRWAFHDNVRRGFGLLMIIWGIVLLYQNIIGFDSLLIVQISAICAAITFGAIALIVSSSRSGH